VSLLTIPSIEPKAMKLKDKIIPRYVYHFTMNYDQWRAFYDHKKGDVYDDWVEKLIPHLERLGITCAIAFRYHHTRLVDSRKKNCSLFSAKGHCKGVDCPVDIEIFIEDEPKSKGRPCVFKVVVTDDKNHNAEKGTMSRPLKGAAREAMGML